MLFFYFKFILTNIVFSVVIGMLAIRYAGNKTGSQYTNWEIMLYCLGLGPIVTSTILYYMLLVFRGFGDWLYILVVSLFFGILAMVAFYKRSSRSLWSQVPAGTVKAKPVSLVYWLSVAVLILLYIWGYVGMVRYNYLEGHDALIYGNYGKVYYNQKEITYQKIVKPAKNGFMFQGSQKPAFSLLLTWERLLNNKEVDNSPYFDTYFRSISGYYSFLILAVAFLWLFRRNKYLALLGVFMLIMGLRFYIMLLDHHIDSFRIFFLTVSWIWLAYAVKRKDWFSFMMLAIFSGFAAFAHTIGLVIALINVAAYFLFSDEGVKKRFVKSWVMIGILMALGGFHYLLEAVIGSESGFLNYL